MEVPLQQLLCGFRVDHSPAAGSIIVFLPGQSVGGQWTADGAYLRHVAYYLLVATSCNDQPRRYGL